MQKKLPKTVKYLLCFALLLVCCFILFSFSVAFFKFPVSSDQLIKHFAYRGSENNQKTNPIDESLFGNLSEGDKPLSITSSDVYANLLEERVSIESELQDYKITFSLEQIDSFLSYVISRNFFSENSVIYTYNSEELLSSAGESPEVKFITPETLTVYLTDDIDNARIHSGSEIDMGVDYIARDGNVAIRISVNPEDIKNNVDLVERTFSGLMYQGVYVATRASSSTRERDSENSDEYLLTPPEFYAVLETSTPLVSIESRSLTSLLLRLGILKEANAYCAGSTQCTCSSQMYPPCTGGCRENALGVCVRTSSCYWDSGLGRCANACPGYDYLIGCYWVNPPAPPPGTACSNVGGSCKQDGDCCGGLECTSGICNVVAQNNCSCNANFVCAAAFSGTCGGACTKSCLNVFPDDACGVDADSSGDLACACTVVDRCKYCGDCGSSCGESAAPTCGTFHVYLAGTTTPATCTSGNVDIVVTDVMNPNADSAVVVASISEGNTKTYTLTQQDPGTSTGRRIWQKLNVDLEEDIGYGVVTLKFFPSNCYATNNDCTPSTVQIAAKPDCPEYLYLSPLCGATTSRATFSWGDYYGGSMVKPDEWVLRVNYDDYPAIASWDAPEWMSSHDYWKYVPYSASRASGIGSCGWNTVGAWECKVTLDGTTSSYGGFPFTAGHYDGWSVQPIDACGNYSNQCSSSGAAFDCVNTLPSCDAAIFGPSTLFAGQAGTYTVSVTDTVDPIYYTWSSDCGGTFGTNTNPPSPPSPTAPHSNLSVGWAPGALPAENAFGKTCTLSLTLADHSGLISSTDSTICTKAVTVRNPQISGRLFLADDISACTGSSIPSFTASPSNHIFRSAGSINVPITTSTGAYSTYLFQYEDLITAMGLSTSDLVSSASDTRLQSVCMTDNRNPDAFSVDHSLGLTGISGRNSLTSDLQVNIGYRLLSSIPIGWFTVNNGAFYSGNVVTMAISSAPQPASWFSDGLAMTNKLAFSSSNLNISATGHSDVVSSLGYVKNLSSGLAFNYRTPSSTLLDSLTTINSVSAFANLNPNTIYKMDVSIMNDVLQNSSIYANYGTRISSDGVVIIYLTGDDNLEFRNRFQTASVNRKILFITDRNVVFHPAIVETPTLFTEDPNSAHIEASIITSGNVSFPSGIEISDQSDPKYDPDLDDGTLVIYGSLFAGNTVDFSRDRRLQNEYPAVAVLYDTAYLRHIQRQINANAAFEKHFFSIVSVSWELED